MARAYPGLGLDTAPTRPWARRFSFRNGGGLVDAPDARMVRTKGNTPFVPPIGTRRRVGAPRWWSR